MLVNAAASELALWAVPQLFVLETQKRRVGSWAPLVWAISFIVSNGDLMQPPVGLVGEL